MKIVRMSVEYPSYLFSAEGIDTDEALKLASEVLEDKGFQVADWHFIEQVEDFDSIVANDGWNEMIVMFELSAVPEETICFEDGEKPVRVRVC